MAHPNSAEAIQRFFDEEPFAGMLVDDSAFLNDLNGRRRCPKCYKSRKYFCYTCYVPVTDLEGKLPLVKLPLKIDVIKHRREIDGKSTAAHAALLAPQDVSIYTYPDIPDYTNRNIVLIFPSYNAVNVGDLFRNVTDVQNPIDLPKGQNQTTLLYKKRKSSESPQITHQIPIEGAVFIDSTWNQSKGIFKDPRISSLKCVVLQNRISQFWRHQKGSPRWYLSTIEAIHQFLIEIHLNVWGLNRSYRGLERCVHDCNFHGVKLTNGERSYNGQYDNLLFFFKHMYDLIHLYYDHENLHAYKRDLI